MINLSNDNRAWLIGISILSVAFLIAFLASKILEHERFNTCIEKGGEYGSFGSCELDD